MVEDIEERKTTIVISLKLKKRLQNLGKMGDTYESVIWRLVEFYEKNKGEHYDKEEGS